MTHTHRIKLPAKEDEWKLYKYDYKTTSLGTIRSIADFTFSLEGTHEEPELVIRYEVEE